MRIGLIAALRHSEEGSLRAALPLAGRSVIAWQAALLQTLGCERVLCLAETPGGTVLELQHRLEGQGVQFHALRGLGAIPALVRAEDDLVILADGLVPEPAVVRALVGGEGDQPLQRMVATIPADHTLAAAHPEDFERIDAARHWGGVLVMRGAPAQRLADFPADADAVSLLLRLALQAGTPPRELAARELAPETWLLANSEAAVARHEGALIAAAARPADWRAPGTALASAAVRAMVPRGLEQGPVIAGCAALVLLFSGVMAAAFGFAATGLALAGFGALMAQVSQSFAALDARLCREAGEGRAGVVLTSAGDVLAGVILWFGLAPFPEIAPLAALGPVAYALARLAARGGHSALAAAASDRAGLLLILAFAAALGLLPQALACLALGLCAALLLRGPKE
jgi:type IV secretory pathway TrbD component